MNTKAVAGILAERTHRGPMANSAKRTQPPLPPRHLAERTHGGRQLEQADLAKRTQGEREGRPVSGQRRAPDPFARRAQPRRR